MFVDLIDALGLRERKMLETRRALVSVTLELFAERGVNTTTVRAETLTASADAMGEFLVVEACATEARRLEEMRLVAIEDRLDAELASGAASALVAELESLVARYGLRERL